MPLKSNRYGYLLIDHTNSPGLPACDGFDPRVFGEGKKYEADIKTCSHCQRGVVKNPLRVRARAYCPKCDAYICDQCEVTRVLTGECVPFKKRMDLAAEKAIRELL